MSRLNELLTTDENKCYQIAEFLGCNETIVYDWRDEKTLPSFDNMIKLADYFSVSIDYILGRSDNDVECHTKELVPFSNQLKSILDYKHISKYRLFKDCKLSSSFKVRWFNQGVKPNISNLLKVADYLNISMDELMGRII